MAFFETERLGVRPSDHCLHQLMVDMPTLVPETPPAAPPGHGGGWRGTTAALKRVWRKLRIWLVPVLLIALACPSFVYLRKAGGAQAGSAAACSASDWRTTVTLDRSRPELAATTLGSLGPPGSETCVEASLGCLRNGPYFEVRLVSPTLAIGEVGPLQIRNLNDELAAQIFRPQDLRGGAVRIDEKPAVELIAYALANSLGFRVPITFSGGESGEAEFKSYHFTTAVRPVLFACDMRSLQSAPPETDDDK